MGGPLAAGGSTVTVVEAAAVILRSSKATALTMMGPEPVSAVSRVARLLEEVIFPLLALKRTVTGRLSGLAASQVMVVVSPARTVAGDATHAIVGGLGRAAVPGCSVVTVEVGATITGASAISMSSTWSPAWMSCSEVRTIAVALCG